LAVRLIVVVIPPAIGFCVLWLGQDASWDLRNYHFYNPFAYLTGRMGHDIAVAQVATYYNPLMYLPFYYAVSALPPKAVGFTLGLISGLNIFLLYAMARRVIHLKRTAKTAWFSLATALVGMLGAVNLAEIGTTFGDNVVSLPVLAAVWLILRHRDRLKAPGLSGFAIAAASGVLAGAAFGLKLPFAVYAVGLCAAFFGLTLPFQRRFLLAFVFGLGVLVGAALTGGFWMAEMWERFRNPIFPYFNQYFKSPWGAPESYRDERFIPRSLPAWLFFPIWFNLDPLQVGEVPFRDLRFPVLYLLLVAWLVKTIAALRRKPKPDTATAALPAGSDLISVRRFVIVFMAVSFVLWMKLFAVYRYLIVCDFLAPLALFLVIGALVPSARRHAWLAIGCFTLILVTLEPASWGRRPWATDYFGVQAPELSEPANTLVLVTGHDPMAYMIPFFPPEVRFLRIQGYLTGPSPNPNDTDRLMRGIIAGHQGPIFVIYRSYEEIPALEALKAYGLEKDASGCRKFVPHVEPQQEHPFCFCAIIMKERTPLRSSGTSN
jgi:hypothetical protein